MKNPLQLVGLAIVACTVVVACSSTSSKNEPTFRTIARGYQSGIAGPGVEVARNEREWSDLWARHTSTVLPRPELPHVDFDRDMVVFASIGVRPTMGYAFEIERVTPQEHELVLEAIERRPATDAILPQVASQPFHMITVRQREGKVRLSTAVQGPSNP
jgi:hypothetical protein